MFHGRFAGRAGDAGRRAVGLSAIVAVTAALTACQGDERPVVSLEEAKKITAKFEGSTFTPPPRTIKDITDILDKEKRVDLKAAAEARAAATQNPPAGADQQTLAMFYWNRGQAADKIGMVKQALADLREAERLSRGTYGDFRGDALWDLGVVELNAGNLADSIRNWEESIKHTSLQGKVLSHLFILSTFFAEMGNFDKADSAFADARNIFDKAQTWPTWEQWGDLWTLFYHRAKSRILYHKGKYAEAEPIARKAVHYGELNLQRSDTSKYNALILESTRGFMSAILLRQGRLVEAEIEARKAVTSSLRRLGRYSAETARTLQVLSTVIGAEGRHAEAERLARAIVDIYQKTGTPEDSYYLAKARGNLADFLVDQGRWREALAEYHAVDKAIAGYPESIRQVFARDLGKSLSLLGVGRNAEALAAAEEALRLDERTWGADHERMAQARGVVGVALARSGRRDQALAAFTKAVPALIAANRKTSDESEFKAAEEMRLGMILESYIGLLADIRGTDIEKRAKIDAAAEAFRIADVARGQTVQRALAASASRAAARNPELADLVRRQQDTEKQLEAAFERLAGMLSAPTAQQDAKAVQAIRARGEQLRAAQAALAGEIEKRFPDYARLINPKPATIDDARRAMTAGEALISSFVGEKRTYVWAIPKSGPVAFNAADIGRHRLGIVVSSLRADLEPDARTLGDITPFDLKTAYDLYARILKPVEAGWKDAKSLLVVAHDALGYLPLSLLPTRQANLAQEKEPLFSNYREVPWLARTHAVTMLPSVASLAALRALPPGGAKRQAFVGFGDPLFSQSQAAEAANPPKITAAVASRGGLTTRSLPVRLRAAPRTGNVDSAELALLPRLPDTADELRSIGLALHADLTRNVFVGKDATETRIKSMDLSGFRILAFATHGLKPGDLNGLSQPALALSSPKVVGGTDDGLLTMGEILGLKLDADWVVLSACNTGSGKGTGAEAVSGLGRAFFYAGTRALLVSNWPVETTSARLLTTDLFRRQAGNPALSRAEALRQAMIGLIDSPGAADPKTGKILFSYAHPLFWAAFSLVGDGGTGRPAS